jgi:WD40 repeat protein
MKAAFTAIAILLGVGGARLPGQGSAVRPELVLQSGHADRILAVACSADGRWLASASGDKTIRLWETASGREARVLAGHTGSVTGAAFTRDGARLFSASNDKTIKIWDVASGAEVRTLSGHTEAVRSLAITPDGRRLLSGSQDRSARLWDLSSGRELRAFSGHTGAVLAVAISPDGLHGATASRDRSAKLWDLTSGAEQRTLEGHVSGVEALAFSPDGKWLATGSVDRSIVLWQIAGKETRTLTGHTEAVRAVAFSTDGRWLASAGQSNQIKIWDLAAGREARVLEGHAGGSNALTFTADGRTLVSGGEDNAVRRWETGSWRALPALTGQVSGLTSLAFSPDSQWLALGIGDKSAPVKMLALTDNRAMQALTGSSASAVSAVAFSPDGRLLAAAEGWANSVKIWEAASGRELRTLTPPTPGTATKPWDIQMPAGIPRSIDTVTFSPDSRWVAAGDLSGVVRIWDLATGRERLSLKVSLEGILSLAFSPDGRWLLTSSADKTVKLWEVPAGREVRTLSAIDSVVWGAAFSGGLIAAGGSDKAVHLWEAATGREVRSLIGHSERVTTLAFSNDGKLLASGGPDMSIRLWETESGREVRSLFGHTGAVRGLAFSPDGRWLASASGDGSVRLWDPFTGEEMALLTSVRDGADWLMVTPEGLFDGSDQGTKRLVAWRIGGRILPPDRFFADFYTPGLLGRILSAKQGAERPKPDVALAALKLPPDVRIVSPAAGPPLPRTRNQVRLELKEQGGGVGEVRLYHNGKQVASVEGGGKASYVFDLDLVPGENILRAVALSSDRVEGNDDVVRVTVEAGAGAQPSLHVLAVGINEYEDRAFNLGFARADAEAIARFFESRDGGLFGSVKVTRLLDRGATQAAIRQALEKIAGQARPEDVFVAYFAGHGVGVDQQFYFLPHEMRAEGDERQAIVKHGLTATAIGEALQRIPALKQVLILDTCQAGTALPILAKAVKLRGLGMAERKATQMLARSNGVYLIAAATKQQYAVEVPALGHGVLAYALLSALGQQTGGAKAPGGGRIITMLNVLQEINERIPELTEKYHHGNKQYPVSFNTGMDFPLAVR